MRNLILLSLACALVPPGAAAYTWANSGSGLLRFWPKGAVIPYTFNQGFAPGNNNDLVRAAFRDAFRTWEAAMPLVNGQPAVRFQEAGTTTQNQNACVPGAFISFTDATDSSGTLPLNVFNATIAAGHPDANCGGTIVPGTQGQMVYCGMVFNPAVKFATNKQASDTFDIQSVAMYAAGVCLGLGRSAVNGAVMSGSGLYSGTILRTLHSDDIAGLNAIYGTPGPTISGQVTNASGTPVKGAHVVATDNTTGDTFAAAVSEQDGTYRINGLAPGSYRLFVQPLNGPVPLSTMPSRFTNGNSDFVTVFLPNPVTVGSGETGGLNFQISSPSAMALQYIGIVNGNSLGASAPLAFLRRGTDASIFFRGVTLSGAASFSSPKITLRGPLRTVSIYQVADIHVAADAVLAVTDISLGSSALAGSLGVALNPQVSSGGIVEAAAFNQNAAAPYYAPGTLISIFGTDLASASLQAAAVPLPTQLGGVSVRVGGLLAPLFYVSPTQVNAMIPFEVTGSSVSVSVLTSGALETAAATLALSTAAPRVFTTDGSQGAILNGSKIPNVLVNASSPAAAGDVVVIYCTGLGVVQGSLVTNLPSTGEPVQASVQVTIGGKPAQVQFAGLTPTFVGLYQVNAVVPAGLPAGRVEVVVTAAGNGSNKTLVSVQ